MALGQYGHSFIMTSLIDCVAVVIALNVAISIHYLVFQSGLGK